MLDWLLFAGCLAALLAVAVYVFNNRLSKQVRELLEVAAKTDDQLWKMNRNQLVALEQKAQVVLMSGGRLHEETRERVRALKKRIEDVLFSGLR